MRDPIQHSLVVTVRLLLCGLLGGVSPWAQAGEALPFVYQRGGAGIQGSLHLEVESAVGTREARPFGEEGIEMGARCRFAITDRISISGWGGVVSAGGEVQGSAVEIDSDIQILDQDRHQVNVQAGVGLRRDFEEVLVPQAHLTAHRRWGSFEVAGFGTAQVPQSADRDPVDILAGVGVYYQATSPMGVGLEAAGEDLEGFWVEEEAEGGARLIAGPTLTAKAGHWQARLNVSVVVHPPQPSAPASPEDGQPGFLGRVAAVYTF